MTQDCNDDLCKEKIRAVDQALGLEETQWHTLLDLTKDHEDVRNALRFCEVFQLEAKVKVTNNGYSVLVRDTHAFEMVEDALANGEGFRPECGQYGAVILAREGIQKVIIEVDP